VSRATYWWNEAEGKLERIDYVPERTKVPLIGDQVYENATPLPGSGELLNTKAKHRAYMKEKGLTTMDDFKDTWAKAAVERQQALTPGAGYDRKRRREAISKALYMLESGKIKKSNR
jgi:hypothetical protein